MICISVTPESRQLAKVDIYNAANQCDIVEVCLDRLHSYRRSWTSHGGTGWGGCSSGFCFGFWPGRGFDFLLARNGLPGKLGQGFKFCLQLRQQLISNGQSYFG